MSGAAHRNSSPISALPRWGVHGGHGRGDNLHAAAEGTDMSGKSRLPGGSMRRASQRRSRPAAAPAPVTAIVGPRWKSGDAVRWKEYAGQYLRDVEPEQAHILVGARTYLVAIGELRPG